MKPKAQPCPRQDSRQAKDAQAARSRKETWPTSVSPRDGFTGLHPDAGKDNRQRQGKTAPGRPQAAFVVEAWRGSSIARSGGVSVNHPS